MENSNGNFQTHSSGLALKSGIIRNDPKFFQEIAVQFTVMLIMTAWVLRWKDSLQNTIRIVTTTEQHSVLKLNKI